jgi:chromodomain-helicase-DNA-binding protein 4
LLSQQVTYIGSSDARAYIRDYEFYYPNKLIGIKDKMKKKQVAELRQSKQERIKFDVLLTSHEMAGLDQGVLRSINWECLVNSVVTFVLTYYYSLLLCEAS